MTVLMPSPVFRWFVPAQNGTGLVPAAGYKAKFYAAGTADPKTIYLDSEGTPYPSPSNEAELNSEGYAVIYLGDGGYKLVVTDPDDAEVFTLDNIFGGGSFGSGFVETVIASDDPATNGLAQADTANRFTWCAGYWEIGDGGHGFFWNETSSDPDDTGYTIASTFDPTKRWFRVPDESGSVRAASFGYVGTRSEDLSDQLLAASTYCQGHGFMLTIGYGSSATLSMSGGNFYLYAPFIHFESGSMLTGDGSFPELHFVGVVSGTAEQHFTNFQAYFTSPDQGNANPEWFGAASGALDNQPSFTKWFASNAKAFTLPAGTWNVANTTEFIYPTVPFDLLGTITGTIGSDIPPGVYYPSESRFRVGEIKFPNLTTITGATGNDVAVDGNLTTTGSITSADTANINAGGSLTAKSDVVAGYNGTSGSLSGRIGTSASRFNAGGQYSTLFGSVATSGTSQTNLMDAAIAANSMVNDGDRLRVTIGGNYSNPGSSGTHTWNVIFVTGTLTVFLFPGTNNYALGSWRGVIDIWKSGASFISSGSFGLTDTLAPAAASSTDYETFAIDWTAIQTIRVRATCATAGSVTQKFMVVEYFPAP